MSILASEPDHQHVDEGKAMRWFGVGWALGDWGTGFRV